MGDRIWATVITDASYCDKTGNAGWAAWIRVDGVEKPIKSYGAFKEKVKSSTDAERMAAANGLYLAKRAGANSFLLQTDCMAVVHLITGVTKKCSALDQWRRDLSKAGIIGGILTAKHVKGHTRTKDARSYVNRWCDEMANAARVSL